MSVQAVLLEVLSDHFHVAEIEPPIDYNPHAGDASQGVSRGYIDSSAAFLIAGGDHDTARILDLGEFSERLRDDNGAPREAVEKVSGIFDNFHPATHPVLWRSLIACAALSWILVKLARDHERDPKDLVEEFFTDPRVGKKFDWRGDKQTDSKSVELPTTALQAARRHILERIEWQGDPIRAGLDSK